ncbi:MAG: NAD+ synthase [Nitrospinota bacterium]
MSHQLLRIAIAQLNPTVGAISKNKELIINSILDAKSKGANLLVIGELVLSGYPPEDLLLHKSFIVAINKAINEIATYADGIDLIFGTPLSDNGKLYNGAVTCSNKVIKAITYKQELPNYGMFDEKRYFQSGSESKLVKLSDLKIGLTICEDIWGTDTIVEDLVAAGANLLINISGSPFIEDIWQLRFAKIQAYAKAHSLPFCYINLVGGQDEFVFDGSSFVVDKFGKLVTQAKSFEEDLLMIDFSIPNKNVQQTTTVSANKKDNTTLDKDELTYKALTKALSDYVRKNRFEKVVLGLSGGIDSALVATIATDGLGKENVIALLMPSCYSSESSISDSLMLAKNLEIDVIELPISPLMKSFDETLKELFTNMPTDVTEENIQARIRGSLIMSLSNKFGWLAVTTGNKSELAVGYATLYGDMAGGFAVIKDLFKTKVIELSIWRNQKAGYDLIPTSIITKPPSAELRANQKDSDSLPPYDILDPILEAYIEKWMSIDEIIALGFERELVIKIVSLVDSNEYKRRQAPIGVKISSKAFGRDRRLPITSTIIESWSS